MKTPVVSVVYVVRSTNCSIAEEAFRAASSAAPPGGGDMGVDTTIYINWGPETHFSAQDF